MKDTLDYKISVMQAAKDGKEIEVLGVDERWFVVPNPLWDWQHCNYRVKAVEPMYVTACKMTDGKFHINLEVDGNGRADSISFIELTPEIKQKLGL